MMKFYKFLLIVFIFGLLITPLFHINTAEITEQENRTLAKFPVLKKKGILNTDFGKEFESWLGDRFWGRNQLINARFQALYKINGRIENEEAFIGDDDWMFFKSEIKRADSIKEQKKNIVKNANILKKFSTLLKDKNASIYLITLPGRNDILKKYWEKYYPLQERNNTEEEWQHLLKETGIKVIPLLNEFKQIANTYPPFLKGDTHMNKTGGTILIKQVFTMLKADEPKLKKIKLSYPKETVKVKVVLAIAAKLGMPGKADITYPAISYEIENDKSVSIEKEEKTYFTEKGNWKGEQESLYISTFNRNVPLNKKVVIIGSCITSNLYHFLKRLYSKSVKIRANSLKTFPADATDFVIGKIKELIKSPPDNTTFIIVENDEVFSNIEMVLKELNAL